MRNRTRTTSQRGLTLIELLIAMGLSLLIVLAAVYTFMAARESQRSIDRTSTSNETGSYALQMIGRALMNGGFYPATVPPFPVDITQTGMYDTYPPLPAETRVITDWANPVVNWPPAAYSTKIFGCDGAKINVATSTCGTADPAAADTLVVNYFTSDSWDGSTGQRRDCTGADAGNDPSNLVRKRNTGGNLPTTPHTSFDPDLNVPPQLPIFVSNKFSLNATTLYVDQSDISTQSLACSGNGKSPHGINDTTAYQPILAGVESLQFSYGVYTSQTSLSPDRFYTATEVSGLPALTVDGVALNGWQRVTAVRVCLLTRTLGINTRIADKTGTLKQYKDCNDVDTNQPVGQTVTRFVEVFGLRNALTQNY